MERGNEKVDISKDTNIVSFFDLLARFDFEDHQAEKSAIKSDSSVISLSGESL